jgi:hypothetical protein
MIKEKPMKFTKEFDVDTFEFWSGAEDTVKTIRENDKMEEFGEHIEMVFDGMTPTETEINDYVWFQSDEIFEALGIEND